jgi:hypothetical protein
MADQHTFGQVRVYDSNGEPIPGALARFYSPGTLALVDVYADEALTILHPSPLVADSGGIFPQVFSDALVKVNVTTATGGTVPGYPLDPAPRSIGGGAAASGVSFVASPTVPQGNVQSAIDYVAERFAAVGTASGIVVQTDTNEFTKRTIAGTTGQITVTNGDGIAGNPTIAAVVASQAKAEAGEDATELMTSQRTRQAIDARQGAAKGWQDATRAVATNYQNTNAYPLDVLAIFSSGAGGTVEIAMGATAGGQVKRAAQSIALGFEGTVNLTVPPGWFYSFTVPSGAVTLVLWSERSA